MTNFLQSVVGGHQGEHATQLLADEGHTLDNFWSQMSSLDPQIMLSYENKYESCASYDFLILFCME